MFWRKSNKIKSSEEIKQLLPFSAHRIRLSNGLYTMDGGVIAEKDIRTKIVLDQTGWKLNEKTILDLGCLEGGFTSAFASLGAKMSVGIEAREISHQRCEFVRHDLGLSNLRFIRGDIKEVLPQLEPFDIIFAAGILYHVDDPHSLLKAIHAICQDFVIIDTHVAPNNSTDLINRTFDGRIYKGCTYREYDLNTPKTKVDNFLWAAYSDHESFWPLEDSLVQMLFDVGFSFVFKVYPSPNQPWQVDQKNRILIIAKKK